MRTPLGHDVGETRRSRVVVLLIALSRLIKGLLLAGLGALEIRVLDSPQAQERLVALVDRLGIDPRQPRIDHLVQRLLAISDAHLRAYEIATFLYAALFLTEAVGLACDQRWAEWLVVVSTALLIPVELWNVLADRRWDHAWIVVLNVAVAAYLLVHVRRRMRARADAAGTRAA